MPWTVATASAVGAVHGPKDSGDDCCMAWLSPESEWCFVVAADGAGSAERSHQGARLACSFALLHAVYSCSDLIDSETFGRKMIKAIRTRLKDSAKLNGYSLNDLATTLVFAAISPTKGTVVQVGDGAAILRLGSELISTAHDTDQEFLNVTRFITDTDAIESARIDTFTGPITEAFVVTDGLSPLVLHSKTGEPHAPFFDALSTRLSGREPGYDNGFSEWLETMLQSEAVKSRSDDDASIAVAQWRS